MTDYTQRQLRELRKIYPLGYYEDNPLMYDEIEQLFIASIAQAGQVAIKRYQELIQEELEQELTKAKMEAIAKERARVVGLIKSRKPNEYAVRQYKTMEARTWDEKNLVIEALDDLLSSLEKLTNNK